VVWRKQGLLFEKPRGLSWANSHAALPVALTDGDSNPIRLLFSSRDAEGRSRVAGARLDLAGSAGVTFSEKPLLDLGELGAFDDSGVTTSCCVRQDDRLYLFYTGWSLGVTVPFYLSIGCAISEDGGRTFSRVARAPVVGRNPVDPLLTASPWVLVEGGRWRMWYVSGTEWTDGPDQPRHRYNIRYAESPDGLDWDCSGHVCVDYRDSGEYAIARPCVIRDGSLYRMWYSYRGPSNRIGYAESADGLSWERKDGEVGIDVSPSGWDSEMIEYPCVFDHQGARHMLYNGNGYGKSGVGHATLANGGGHPA
jgi:hypothetical protein